MNVTVDPSHTNCDPHILNCSKCLLRYTGEFCEIDVFDIDGVYAMYVIHIVITIVTTVLVLIWCLYGLYHRIKQKSDMMSVAMVSIYFLLISIVIRGIGMFDFLNMRLIYSNGVFMFLYWMVFIFIYASATLSVSGWLSIISQTKNITVQNEMTLPKTITSVFSFSSVVALLILCSFGFITSLWNSAAVGINIAAGLYLVGSLVLITIYLPTVFKRVKEINYVNKDRLIRMNYYVVYYQLHCIIALMAALSYTLLRAFISETNPRYPVIYFSLQFVNRFIEASYQICILLIVFDWIPYISRTQLVGTDSKSKSKSKVDPSSIK